MWAIGAMLAVLSWVMLLGGILLIVFGPTRRRRWIGVALLLALVVFAGVSALGMDNTVEFRTEVAP